MGRIWALAALAAGIWLLSAYGQSRPEALGLGAPATQFSAARADAVLGRILDQQRPHPAGSAESAAVRARILRELAALNVPAQVQSRMSCFSEPRWGSISCGTVNNIIVESVPGPGRQIVMVAHTDSVAAGPGAGDDMSGVATILETIRALKARGRVEHPIVALFTDGEESGLLGAAAYLRDRQARDRIGVVINMESRGNQGPSYLFQTGAGDARLIDLYARAVPRFAASSLYGEIYKYLPNDTDMTPFLAADVTGYNFAFIGNAAHYHTPLDRRQNIDPRSLQQHGDNLLALADALGHTDLAALHGGNVIYLDILGRWLPRLPQRWSLPLSIAAFGIIALAAIWRRRHTMRRSLLAVAAPPVLLAGSIAMGYGLHGLAAWISGHADPSFAHPVWLRLSLAFGVFAVALLAARAATATVCWLWLASLAIVCAIWAPGVAPYFLFPCLVAAPLLLVSVWHARGLAVFVAALTAMLVWLGLNQGGEAIMGLVMHPLFTITAAFALLPLLPLLATAKSWKLSAALSLMLAIGLAVTAGLRPAYSIAAPERLNLRYVESEGKAWWLADPVARLPESLRTVADFSAAPRRMVGRGYVASAGPARYAPPAASVSRDGDTVTLDMKTPDNGVTLMVPAEAKLRSAQVGPVTIPAFGRRIALVCVTPDCGTTRIILQLGSPKPVSLELLSFPPGMPPDAAKLLKARPPEAVPSQEGDLSVLAAKIAVPGR